MGYRVISMKDGRYGRKSEADEFFHAAEQAREAIETMHCLAEEMEDRYSSRFGDRYDRRDYEMWDDEMHYGDRRRRDSMGRYR